MEGFRLAADKLRDDPAVSTHLYTLHEEMHWVEQFRKHNPLVKEWKRHSQGS